MNIKIDKRVEIALRNLSDVDNRKILKALELLKFSDFETLLNSKNLKRLKDAKGETLYSYHGSTKLRLIISINDNSCYVEDLISLERLERLLPQN